MPELPEVETTAKILDDLIRNKRIISVWTDYNSPYFYNKNNIKDPKYFNAFKKNILNHKILKVWRRAKNVLIDISGEKTILIHMKMTGHLLYGKYIFDKTKNKWRPADPKSSLADPFNRFIHLVFKLDDGKYVAFSDMRKFATVKLIADKKSAEKEFAPLGPEPLEKNFKIEDLKKVLLKKPQGKIKTILMDTKIISGIGNIYSDEILWNANIHPERKINKITSKEFQELFHWIKKLLKKGINLGGDSMSDYRNPFGNKGKFQNHHNAYRLTGQKCKKKKCLGIIIRKTIATRNAHFCNLHQN